MRPGKIKIFVFLFYFLSANHLYSEDNISTSPLINLEQLKPSFEEVENLSNIEVEKNNLKEKKTKDLKSNIFAVKVMGLDKITAKTSLMKIKLGETMKYGVLEIKALKCGKIKKNNIVDEAAYIQVKDISQSQSEQVFIFNGWTFSSNPALAPIDHAIYDLWLVGCESV